MAKVVTGKVRLSYVNVKTPKSFDGSDPKYSACVMVPKSDKETLKKIDRYQDILDYEIDVPAELYPYRIPKITLQPLVENALYHGIKNRRGKGTIRVTGEKREDCLCLMVLDDGIGIPPDP